MEDEVLKKLEDYEKRLKKIEGVLFAEKKSSTISSKRDYKGLVGGIRLQIDNGFLRKPRTVDEIKSELEREGYYYTFEGVASTLSERFLKGERTLARRKENDKWKYVLRK